MKEAMQVGCKKSSIEWQLMDGHPLDGRCMCEMELAKWSMSRISGQQGREMMLGIEDMGLNKMNMP